MTGTTPPLIAVVEDDALVRESIASLLRSLGYAVAAFASAGDFLALPSHGAALVLSDLRLNGLSGIDLLETLRARGDRVPVVVMSALIDPAARLQVKEAGGNAVLEKPWTIKELLRCLDDLLPPHT